MGFVNRTPVSSRIGFSNVKANGKVGLLLKQDSFVPQNYDIKYEPTDVVVRVRRC
jgi:hypothetical protein